MARAWSVLSTLLVGKTNRLEPEPANRRADPAALPADVEAAIIEVSSDERAQHPPPPNFLSCVVAGLQQPLPARSVILVVDALA